MLRKLVAISTLLVVLLANECPNTAFQVVARYNIAFSLNQDTLNQNTPHTHTLKQDTPDKDHRSLYWVAFGSQETGWTLTLAEAKKLSQKSEQKLNRFVCNENFWRAVKKPDKSEICCASSYLIDRAIPDFGHHTKFVAKPFAVLPQRIHNHLRFVKFGLGYGTSDWKSSKETSKRYFVYQKAHGAYMDSWKAMWQSIGATILTHRVMVSNQQSSAGAAKEFGMVWRIMKLPEEMTGKKGKIRDDAKKGKLFQGNWPWPYSGGYTCTSQGTCDTGIMNDIVVFDAQCEGGFAEVLFAFSDDGTFDLTRLVRCPDGANIEKVRFYAAVDLFGTEYSYFQTAPTYGSLDLGWQLGSFCASCTGTSMSLQITEKEAKSNKKRVEHAIAAGISGGKPAAANFKYTRKWFHEASETTMSGRGTVIKADCNAFYLYYYTINLGTWGNPDVRVPTQMFYCTDRDTPPICKPRIGKISGKDREMYGDIKICDGHDVYSDFYAEEAKARRFYDDKNKAKEERGYWQSKHDGRSSPFKITQPVETKLLNRLNMAITEPVEIEEHPNTQQVHTVHDPKTPDFLLRRSDLQSSKVRGKRSNNNPFV